MNNSPVVTCVYIRKHQPTVGTMSSKFILRMQSGQRNLDTLKTHHEGTSHVKETKVGIEVRKFELLQNKRN